MLVLARRADESLEFPELGVVIRVMSVRKNKVHLGIDAPQRIKIRRTELPPESSDIEPSASTFERRFESHRLSHALERLESQIAALSELASNSNRELAKQVAADSQQQIEKIGRLLLLVNDSAMEDRLQEDAWSTRRESEVACVRQSSSDYAIGDGTQEDDDQTIYQLDSEKTVWFPGLSSESELAIA